MKFLRTLLYGLAVFALPVHASVVLGQIGIESDVPITGEEDVIIYNVTGPIFGCSTAAGRPICTAVTFDNSVLTVNGIVQQHGGARTVWINGKAQNSNHGGESASETVAVPGKAPTIKIKVGQKLLLDTAAPQSAPAPSE